MFSKRLPDAPRGMWTGIARDILWGMRKGIHLGFTAQPQRVPWWTAMPIRTARPDAQIEQLAAEFRRCWVAADGIEPWLRRQAARLDKLVRAEGWSWDDVGRALTAAGITYVTGRPWSGRILAIKAAEVRLQLRARDAARQQPGRRKASRLAPTTAEETAVGTAAAPSGTLAQPPTASLPGSEAEPPRRTFGLASPRGWTPPPAPPATEPKPSPSAPAPAIDVDAVIARFLGRPDPSISRKDGS